MGQLREQHPVIISKIFYLRVLTKPCQEKRRRYNGLNVKIPFSVTLISTVKTKYLEILKNLILGSGLKPKPCISCYAQRRTFD